jgi:transcription elongation factor/antiterminator RfaH
MKHWYALYTKPKMERQVSTLLDKKGIQTYLPLVEVPDKKRPGWVKQPFFPCYLFAQADLDVVGRGALAWTPGLRRLVGFDGEPAIVGDDIIAVLQKRLAEKRGRRLLDERFRPGERVVITTEPFQGFEAVFAQTLSASGRVRVLLNYLGRQMSCEVNIDTLEKFEFRNSDCEIRN